MSLFDVPGFTYPKDSSDEKKIKLFKKFKEQLLKELIEKEDKEWEEDHLRKNQFKSERGLIEERTKYDYESKLGIRKERVPSFMRIFLTLGYMEDKEKDKFVEDIGKPYLTDNVFRENLNYRKIVIMNNKFVDIVSDIEGFNVESHPEYSGQAFFIRIDPNNIYAFLFSVFQTDKLNREFEINNLAVEHSFTDLIKVDVYFSDNYDSGYNRVKMIFDTGCNITMFPFSHLWNYANKCFLNDRLNDEYLHGCEVFELNTANGKRNMVHVFLKRPFFVKIGNCMPVPLKVFVIDEVQPSALELSEKMLLLGMDIIGQLKSSLDIYTDEFQLRMTNFFDNNWNK